MNKFNLILYLLLLLPILSCGSKKSDIKPDAEKNSVSVTETKKTIETENKSSVEDLEKAKNEGKIVFLVITGSGASGIDKAINIAKESNTKTKNSIVVQMNRDQANNSSLVSKFGIAAVPIPFILVISPNGIPVGGMPSAMATSDHLIKTIPSPKQDAVFYALSEKKPVFIVVSKKGYSDRKSTIANCEAAGSKITTKSTIVEIDFDDKNEKTFLTQIGVPTINGKTITVVVNSAGQITEIINEKPAVEKLTAAVNKVVQSSGCCPGGSNQPGCK